MLRTGLFATFALVLTYLPVHAQETPRINAYAPLASSGSLLQTAEDEVSFVGTTSGLFFLETAEGLTNAGNLSCSLMLEITASSGAQKGNGRCVVTGTQGNQIFGRFSCSGQSGKGCLGEISMSGSADGLGKVTGKGAFTMRNLVVESISGAAPVLPSGGTDGIMIWRDVELERTPPSSESSD